MNRRHFLRGLGGFTLSLPYLTGLHSLKSLGQTMNTPPKRFFCIVNQLGYYENNYYPKLEADTKHLNDVFYRRLSSIPGNLSDAFGTEFDGLRSKMNIYRGLDVVGATVHSRVPALCAAIDDDGSQGLKSQLIPTGTSLSIDVILGRSKSFYNNTPNFLALRGQDPGPDYYNANFSFDRDPISKQRIRVPYSHSPQDIFNQVFSSQVKDPGVQEQIKSGKILIADAISEEYNKLILDRRLASESVRRVKNFVEHMQSVHKKMVSQKPILCAAPSIPEYPDRLHYFQTEEQKMEYFKSYFDVMIAAMACDVTRVGVVTMGSFLRNHGLSHASPLDPANQAQYNALTRKMCQMVRDCAKKMDSFVEADGSTMLDNSLLYWTYELSEGAAHRTESMPAVSFGSAGGNIKTGYYMDYRQKPLIKVHPKFPAIGRSYTQLFATFFRALGVPQNEFTIYGDGEGLGSFKPKDNDVKDYYLPYKSQRNNVLPFISNVA